MNHWTGYEWRHEPLCAACGTVLTHHYVPSPCTGCGRSIYDRRPRKRVYCGAACVRLAYNRRRRVGHQAQPCATCGQPYTPPRRDGRYCSPACRQRAHRQRQASA